MDNKPKPNSDETLRRLLESLDADVLTDAVTDAEVDQELREAGGDPAEIVKQGRAVVAQLLERRRLAWQDEARKKLAAQRALLQPSARRAQRTRPQLLAEIQRVRTDPALRGTAAMAFHKRKPEETSGEELEQMLEEFEMLKKLSTHGDAKDK